MDKKELTSQDYENIIEVLKNADQEGRSTAFYNIEKHHLLHYPNLYARLIELNDNSEINPILIERKAIAERKLQGWLWCQEICEEEIGAKKYGDWLSYQGPHFSEMEKLYEDFLYLKKNSPLILHEKARDSISKLEAEIKTNLKAYDPNQWENHRGSNIPDDKMREIDKDRSTYLFSFLQNNLLIRVLRCYFSPEKNGQNESIDEEAPTFLDLFRQNEERMNKFFNLLKSPYLEALDENNNWVYNHRKSSIKACFIALRDLEYIKYRYKTDLRRIVESKIKFIANDNVFYQRHNPNDYDDFKSKFEKYL
jgi:hypothetical protein